MILIEDMQKKKDYIYIYIYLERERERRVGNRIIKEKHNRYMCKYSAGEGEGER